MSNTQRLFMVPSRMSFPPKMYILHETKANIIGYKSKNF